MQGKKTHQEKLFIQFQLSDYVPADNFYRELNRILDLSFLYKSTSVYYGKEGQKSVDPVVFMKLMLVGYLENINSDRHIIRISSMRMDLLFFLGYDLDEELPWHSTLSRTRKLYGEEQFLSLFKQVLKLCIDEGLISGKRQAVDSALIRANASKESMIEKQVMDDADIYTKELEVNAEDEIGSKTVPLTQPGARSEETLDKKRSSINETHISPSDPDARLTKKPGKPMNLYYRSQMSVDTASHFITYIQAFRGNVADNISLIEMVPQIVENMRENYLGVKEILADTGYSSGEAISSLIAQGIEGYIPNTGSYKPERDKEGFTYNSENDSYTCLNGVQLTFRRFQQTHGVNSTQQKIYATRPKDCRDCPFKSTCATSAGFKAISDSVDKPLYDQMHQRIESKKGKRMKKLRSSTVEPVFGSLINYTGLNRINTKGLKQANKCMIMAAVAYNLKKLLKHNKIKSAQSNIKKMEKDLNSAFYQVLTNLRRQYAKHFLFQL